MNLIYGKQWLAPHEQLRVVDKLFRYGLIKVSPQADIPLKNGDKTDVYVSLRKARNNPEAIKFLAEIYEIPINAIGNIDRIIEVPWSITCITPLVSVACNIPYATIRDVPKPGRASDAEIVEEIQFGDNVVIIDDVITDGASKVAPYEMCLSKSATCLGIIVLVDRQQGWRKTFDKHGIPPYVYAGMTLDDVRSCLNELGKLKLLK